MEEYDSSVGDLQRKVPQRQILIEMQISKQG